MWSTADSSSCTTACSTTCERRGRSGRPSMGVPEPLTGPAPEPSQLGTLFAFLFFSTTTLAGHVQVMERGPDRVYLTGLVRDRRHDPPVPLAVTDARLELELFPATRRC